MKSSSNRMVPDHRRASSSSLSRPSYTATSTSTSSSSSPSLLSTPPPPNSQSNKRRQSAQRSQKKGNTSALLDQYQDDDDLTTNLIHAIRSWNLERPPTTEPTEPTTDANANANDHGPLNANATSGMHHQTKQRDEDHLSHDHDCNSTINTMNSDIDTAVTIASSSSMNASIHNHKNHSAIIGGTSSIMTGGSSTVGSCNSSTVTNGSSSNYTNASNSFSCNSAIKKTPCRGNYSSRPSGLTARILLESEEFDNDENDNHNEFDFVQENSNSNNSNMAIIENEESAERDHSYLEQSKFIQSDIGLDRIDMTPIKSNNVHRNRENQEETKQMNHQGEHNKVINHDAILLSTAASASATATAASLPSHSSPLADLNNSTNNNTQNEDAMSILQETALTLGLHPNDELQKILPTIKKLVRVVMVHVPNLERFVDNVCDIVMKDGRIENNRCLNSESDCESGLESGMETDDCEESKCEETTHRRRRRSRRQQRRKKPKKKNMQARKKKMDEAVQILKEEWHDKAHMQQTTSVAAIPPAPVPSAILSPSLSKPLRSQRALQKVNVNNVDSRFSSDSNDVAKAKHVKRNGINSTAPSTLIHGESSFRDAIIEKLKRCQDLHTEAKEILYDDTEQALEMIETLINFEQRYRKVHGIQNKNESARAGIQSPPQSNSILRKLFNADVATLRRFVLHFAYLFSVSQEEIMSKMNDVYVFSLEAGIMIEDIKKSMSLSSTCPIHSVARKVIKIIERSSEEKSVSKQSTLVDNFQQERDQHVRFNAVVEEFS